MNTSKKNVTASALRTPLAALVSAIALCLPGVGVAAEPAAADAGKEAGKEERVEITGSRIKRVDLEGASPIIAITAEDLARSGATTVAEALRGSELNSFGSWGGGSNNGWGSQATVDLKGLGIDRSLVLLNGRRMVKSPVVGGGAANINLLPITAIERIEIMSDGASAIYGTDAIAGVVNIILRDDFDGMEVSASTSKPTRDGGEYNRYSISGGSVSDKSRSIFVYEHDEFSTLFQRDRDYTRNRRADNEAGPDTYQGWTGISASGRTIVRASDGSWAYVPMVTAATGRDNSNLCDVYNINGETSFFAARLEDANYPGEFVCGYDYTNRAAISAGQTRDTLFYSLERDINEDWTASVQTYFGRSVTDDISAPTPASFTFRNNLPSYTTAQGVTVTEVFAGDQGAFRLNTLGDRVAEHNDSVLNISFGLQGHTGDFEWDFSAQHNRYNRFVFGTGYALVSAIESKIGRWDAQRNVFVGWDPRDPHSPIPGGIKANYDKKDEGVLNEVFAGVAFDIMELPSGPLAAYVGTSYQQEKFLSEVDGLAEAGVISGGNAGAGGIADRDASAAFVEFSAPVLDSVELNFALRHDDYSDFGTTTNPKFAATWRPTGEMLVRASWGTGFRAPTLLEINRKGQQSFDAVRDYVRCAGLTGQIQTCASNTLENIVTGNKNLKAETSESWNIGYVFSRDAFSFTVDYWNANLEDTIVELSGSDIVYRQYLLDAAASGFGADYVAGAGVDIATVLPGARIVRADPANPTSRIINVYRPSVNAGELEQRGLSASFDYKLVTSAGDVKFHAGWSRMLSRRETLSSGAGISDDYIGDLGWPKDRVSLAVSYVLGEHDLTLHGRYIAGQENTTEDENGATVVTNKVSDSTLWNMTYQWQTPWNVKLGLGVRNLTDEDPAFDKTGSAYNGGLYYDHQFGRTYFADITYSF